MEIVVLCGDDLTSLLVNEVVCMHSIALVVVNGRDGLLVGVLGSGLVISAVDGK